MKNVFSVLRFSYVLLTVFAQNTLCVKRLLINDAQYIESRLNQMDVKIQSLTAQLAAKDQNIALLTNRLNQKDQEVFINEQLVFFYLWCVDISLGVNRHLNFLFMILIDY